MNKKSEIVISIGLVIAGLMFVLPLFWLLLNSFKTNTEILWNSFAWPIEFRWGNYAMAIERFRILTYFRNSIIITTTDIVITIALSLLMGYACAKMKWRFSKAVYMFVLAGYFIPAMVTFVATYQVISALNLLNNFFGLILPYSARNMVLGTLLFYAFIRAIPSDLEESAVLDGCTIFGVLKNIIVPLTKPVMATVAITAFINSWTEFLLASIVIRNADLMPISIGFLTFSDRFGTEYAILFAAMIITIIFPLTVFIIANKNIQNVFAAGISLK